MGLTYATDGAASHRTSVRTVLRARCGGWVRPIVVCQAAKADLGSSQILAPLIMAKGRLEGGGWVDGGAVVRIPTAGIAGSTR